VIVRGYRRPLANPEAVDRVVEDAQLVQELVALLNGERSSEVAVGDLLVRGYALERIVDTFNLLDREGLIVESAPPELGELRPDELARLAEQVEALAAFCDGEWGDRSWPAAGLDAQLRLKDAHVTLVGNGQAARALARILVLAGIGRLSFSTEPDDEAGDLAGLSSFCRFHSYDGESDDTLTNSDLVVYCPDRFELADVLRLNERCVKTLTPLLPLRSGVFMVELGPLIMPRESACYACLETRRNAMIGELDQLTRGQEPSFAFSVGPELLGLEIVKLLSGVAEPLLHGCLWQINLVSGMHELHPVLKLPRCAVCGPPARPRAKHWER